MAIAQSPIYAEVYQFLVSSPTPDQIIAFRASEATQARVRELLDANRSGRVKENAAGYGQILTSLRQLAYRRSAMERRPFSVTADTPLPANNWLALYKDHRAHN